MAKTQARFMHGLSIFGEDGGSSVEQGRYHDQAKVAQAEIPLQGKAPTAGAMRGSGILKALFALFQGNERQEVGRGKLRVFPMNASEARNPQKVPRVRK